PPRVRATSLRSAGKRLAVNDGLENERYRTGNSDGCAISRGVRVDGCVISGLHYILAPPGAHHMNRGGELDRPMLHIPAVTLRVHINDDVGIAPIELRRSSMQSDRLGQVISGHAVVRHHGARKHHQAPNRGQDDEQIPIHETPLTDRLLKRLEIEWWAPSYQDRPFLEIIWPRDHSREYPTMWLLAAVFLTFARVGRRRWRCVVSFAIRVVRASAPGVYGLGDSKRKPTGLNSLPQNSNVCPSPERCP